MPVFDFPTAPTQGQAYTENNVTYVWDVATGAWIKQRGDVPIAGNAVTDLGAVYVPPDSVVTVASDGAIDVQPTTDTQFGVIMDAPYDSLSYARKDNKWVPAGGAVIIADAAPVPGPAVTHGQLWWDSDSGKLYILYEDVDSQQWVQVA
jgi:hypothetical protein